MSRSLEVNAIKAKNLSATSPNFKLVYHENWMSPLDIQGQGHNGKL